jgi:hypothetical protein
MNDVKMIQYVTEILRYAEMGEKTRWMYIEIAADMAAKLNPGCKKSYRVKGKLDNYPIEKVAILPMGEGKFIMPFNAQMRKGTGKRNGANIRVSLELDERSIALNAELMDCLADEPEALKFFKSLNKSHQSYFSKWIDTAKTDATKAKRIAECVNGLLLHRTFSEMLRAKNGGDNYYARLRNEKK